MSLCSFVLQAGRGGKSCGNSRIKSCAQIQAVGYCWETALFICGFSLPNKGDDAWKARKHHSTHNGSKLMPVPRAVDAVGETSFSA